LNWISLSLSLSNSLAQSFQVVEDTEETRMGQVFRKLFDTFFGNSEMRVGTFFIFFLKFTVFIDWSCCSFVTFRLLCLVLMLLAKQLYSTSFTLEKFYLLFPQLVSVSCFVFHFIIILIHY
jgi:hypothetical protein